MSQYPVIAAECVTCPFACSNFGTDYGLEGIKTLAHEHYRTCNAETDAVLLKKRSEDDGSGEIVEEVIGQVNTDGIDHAKVAEVAD